MTLDAIEMLARDIVRSYQTQYGDIEHIRDSDRAQLARAVLRMLPVVREAQLWQRQIIGERTSYDLRLEAALDEFANAIHDHATSASEGK